MWSKCSRVISTKWSCRQAGILNKVHQTKTSLNRRCFEIQGHTQECEKCEQSASWTPATEEEKKISHRRGGERERERERSAAKTRRRNVILLWAGHECYTSERNKKQVKNKNRGKTVSIRCQQNRSQYSQWAIMELSPLWFKNLCYHVDDTKRVHIAILWRGTDTSASMFSPLFGLICF